MKPDKDVAVACGRGRSGLVLRTHALTAGLAGLLVLSVAAAAASGRSPEPAAETVSNAPSCPLSPTQSRAAVKAFDKMMPVVLHPRCLNCHGGVNPFVDPQDGGHIGGRMTDPATGAPMPPTSCEDCHGELPGWDLPGQGNFFVGKSAKDICIQFKQFSQTGAEFVEHIRHDGGPQFTQFIEQGFIGDRALNTLGEVTYEDVMGRPPVPERPPGTHQQFTALAQDWVDAVGTAGWTATPDCGCVPTGAWYGTVTAKLVARGGPYGTLREGSVATIMFELDQSRNTPGDRVLYYKATGGTVQWGAMAFGGQCTGSHEGMVPLDVLDEDGHPMAELALDDAGTGSIEYRAAFGMPPGGWPVFSYRCRAPDGTVTELPAALNLGTWWDYGDPPVTTDPNKLKGSYRRDIGLGVVEWRWELELKP